MDSRKLEELVKKYWDCETSLEEEQQLREYFCGKDVPEQWRETASLFRYFDEQKNKSVEVDFNTETQSQVREIKVPQQPKKGKVVRLFYNAMRIAAGVAVLVLAVYFVRQEIRDENPVALEDTYDDPKQAFEETKKALMMISKGFGSAEQQAKKINVFNEAQETIKGQATNKEL